MVCCHLVVLVNRSTAPLSWLCSDLFCLGSDPARYYRTSRAVLQLWPFSPHTVLPLLRSGTTAQGVEVKFYFRSRRSTTVPPWHRTTAARAVVNFYIRTLVWYYRGVKNYSVLSSQSHFYKFHLVLALVFAIIFLACLVCLCCVS